MVFANAHELVFALEPEPKPERRRRGAASTRRRVLRTGAAVEVWAQLHPSSKPSDRLVRAFAGTVVDRSERC
jgi:hypothetical protein